MSTRRARRHSWLAVLGSMLAVAAVVLPFGLYGSAASAGPKGQPRPTTTVTVTATVTATVTETVTVTASPSPSPTPTPTPSPTPDPTPTPPPSGFPDASNTGVPAGTTLTSYGSCSISTAGAVIDGKTFDCAGSALVIRAAGVTIKNSLIKGQVVGLNDTLQGAHLVDTEIACGCRSVGPNDTPTAIQYNDFTLTRVNIHDSGHGVAMGSNVTVEDSWIHGLGGNTEAHKDGIYVGDGANSVIRHNTITCNDGPVAGCTAAIGLLTDFAPVSYFTIDGNLLNTVGSYCFYGSGGPQKPYGSDHITFTNNVFGKAVYPTCGYYGPVTYFDSSAPGNVWSNNTWADTGELVPPAN